MWEALRQRIVTAPIAFVKILNESRPFALSANGTKDAFAADQPCQ